MFLRKTLVKKMFKKAAAGEHLNIGLTYDGMYVAAGNTWIINVDEIRTPNWFKSLMVEYLGTLPERGEFLEVFDDGWQQGLFTEYYNIDKIRGKSYFITPVILEHKSNLIRIVQDMDSGVLYGMYNGWFDLIDLSELDANEESAPFGPIVSTSGYYVWSNATMKLAVMAGAKIEEVQDIVAAISHISFNERKR